MRIGFIGLGHMGRPMAVRLLNAGHELIVYNRTPERARELVRAGAIQVHTPAAVAREVEVVITMLADDAAVEAVVQGPDGILEALPEGGIHVGMSTISMALADRLEAMHRAQGQVYLSAPVFGRPQAAEAGMLRIVVGGEASAVETCRPIFEVLGQATYHVHERPSRANGVKLAGNFLLASAIEAMGEAFALIRKTGVSEAQAYEIYAALFGSPIYANYGRMIVEDAYTPAGFRLALGLKDVRLVREAAREMETPMPFAGILEDHFLEAMAYEMADLDWAAVAEIAARHAALK